MFDFAVTLAGAQLRDATLILQKVDTTQANTTQANTIQANTTQVNTA
jgi:uncharacterized protein YjbI with pentapeptide repeats